MEENETKETSESREMEEKPRWIDLFERESHRRHQMEHIRDQEYEDIINTLRRGFSQDANDHNSLQPSLGPPYNIPVPAETYFLHPDPTFQKFSFSPANGHHSRSSKSFSSSRSESSFGGSTVTNSGQASSRKCLPPEVAEEKRKFRRRRTAAYICLGVLSLALVALAVGVILHFLLATGSIGGKGEGSGSGLEE